MNHEETGRPRAYEGPSMAMQSVTLRVHVWHLLVAERYGNGSVSDGFRFALEKLAENDRVGAIAMPRRIKKSRVAPC